MSEDPAPLLSVIIPVRDGAWCLDAQLDALAAQDPGIPWELIVCDNGSADGTRALALHRRPTFPAPLRVLDAGAVPGVAFARNAGILAARADRLAICDADDVVGPDWLRGAYEALEHLDVARGPIRRLTDPVDPHAPLLPFASVGPDGFACGNLALRRELALAVGGFDASFTGYGREDYEFFLRVRARGARIGTDERILLHYRISPSPWIFTRKVHASAIADVAIWRRHPDLFPERQSRAYVLREAALLPRELVRAARDGGVRRMARRVVTLGAHARAMLGPPHALPPARLISSMPSVPEVTGESVTGERVTGEPSTGERAIGERVGGPAGG